MRAIPSCLVCHSTLTRRGVQSLPTGADAPVRLSISSNNITANYRAQVYLNGWMLGKYVNNLGPQTDYVLPAG